MARISSAIGVWRLLISVVGFGLDSRVASSLFQRCEQNRAWGKCHRCRLDGVQTHTTGNGARQGFFLHDLEGEKISFYSLFAEKMIHGWLAVVAWSYWSLTASKDLTHASPAPWSSPKALPWSPQASPWFNCFGWRWIKLTQRLSLFARVWGLRGKI
jgi:hypothetical protein